MESEAASGQRKSRRILAGLGYVAAAAGLALLAVNLLGWFVPLRADAVNGYRDFADVETLEFPTVIEQLDELAERREDPSTFLTEATRLFHAGLAHISPDDVEANGLEYYRMRVPLTENWILFALSYLKPDTYRDYEFCHYERALERGTGRCGQQALALVSYLSKHGVDTGFVALGGHAIATAKVDDENWYLLDPDYGGVIPFSIAEAEKNPEAVLPFYWSAAAHNNRIDVLYAPYNRVKYGGPEARFARACPIERVAYALKWWIPVLLIASFPLLLRFSRARQPRSPD